MENKTPNYFVRALIVLILIAMCVLCYFNFFKREPAFEITASLLSLIALIVLLVLSEAFDKLGFGKILSLQRKVVEEKAMKESLKSDNSELRTQLLTLVTNIQQSQVNNTFHAPPEAWSRLLGVVPAPAADPIDNEDGNEQSTVVSNEPVETEGRSMPSVRTRILRQRAAHAIALTRYLDSMNIPDSERLLNAEFSTSFIGIDPIMDRRVIFDGYIKNESRERFIEVTRSRNSSGSFPERLYVMLTKIWLYRQAKKVQAELVLILVETEEDSADQRPLMSSLLLKSFQPAIANDVLRIESIFVSDADIEAKLVANQSVG